jgi:hypothetical protein
MGNGYRGREQESSVMTMPFEQWQMQFRRWLASHQSRNPQFDDSRESIYD